MRRITTKIIEGKVSPLYGTISDPEDGETIANESSMFRELVGKRVRITIEDLTPVREGDQNSEVVDTSMNNIVAAFRQDLKDLGEYNAWYLLGGRIAMLLRKGGKDAKEERIRLVAKMRTDYPMNQHALEWAKWIEEQS